MIALCVASLSGALPEGLDHLGPHAVCLSTRRGWAEAANETLDQAAALGYDAVFADDDVTFTPGCLDAVAALRPRGEVFGWRLVHPDGGAQPGAHHTLSAEGGLCNYIPGERPAYVAHCSTSAIYLAHAVLAAGVRFPVWPGLHCEDVALCVEAWLAGFRVVSLTHPVIHHLTPAGVGRTKAHDADLSRRLQENYGRMHAYLTSERVRSALADGRIPTGARAL